MYLRHLKAITNKAIKEGYISDKHYPFKNYTIGISAKSKDVLYPEQIKALWNYQPIGVRERRAKDFFFFCYLSNGMNFKDVCFLKYRDLKGDILSFVREKTKRTTTVSDKQIRVFLHPQIQNIIERLGNKPGNPNDYIFPILNGRKTIFEKEKAGKQYRRVLNKMLSRIGVKLGFDVHLCLNLARHSFATRLKLDGTPTSIRTQ
jgi:integrase/recombinase XerD